MKFLNILLIATALSFASCATKKDCGKQCASKQCKMKKDCKDKKQCKSKKMSKKDCGKQCKSKKKQS